MMDEERRSLECFAKNIAAAQVAGPAGYTRLIPVLQHPSEGNTPDPFDAPEFSVQSRRGQHNGALVEMLSILEAQRAYEGDASLFAVGKRVIERTIDLERA